jgi:hypothetical protein
VQILYPFHPRCGHMVGVLGRTQHGGEEHFKSYLIRGFP